MQILKNRCFHYFSDFHLQKHPKRELKSIILGQVGLKIPLEKRLEISLGFLLDFLSILGRFGEELGGLFGDFGRLWEVQGVSWRRPREVFSTGCPPEGPRERFGTILAPFWMDFGSIVGAFGMIFYGF